MSLERAYMRLVGLVPVVVMPDFWFEVKDGAN